MSQIQDSSRSPSPRMRVIAAIMGNALEFYDFTVYAAFATWLAKAFFLANNPSVSLLLAVATFGVGFVARPLGGIVIGAYADAMSIVSFIATLLIRVADSLNRRADPARAAGMLAGASN